MRTVIPRNPARMIHHESGNLKDFYRLANELSKNKSVRLTRKQDDADSLEWHYNYKGNSILLEYNIFTGVSVSSDVQKHAKATNKLFYSLETKKV